MQAATKSAPEQQANPAKRRAQPPAPSRAPQVPPRQPSRFLLRFFDIYLSLYVPMHFNALRLAAAERFPLTARPLIVVINHPSWWDPLTSILLSRFLLRGADHYAPIDAVSLPRHRILGSLGLFPVEQGTPRGAAQFLRAAQHILADPNALLWLTPQGSFTDVRTRPVILKAGLASLIKRMDQVTVVPLVYEYIFWNEPRPEMLTLCGRPLTFTRGRLSPDMPDITADPGDSVAAALALAQDELSRLAIERDPGRFLTVMAGHTGVSGPRALARNLAAAFRGRAYHPGATGVPAGPDPR